MSLPLPWCKDYLLYGVDGWPVGRRGSSRLTRLTFSYCSCAKKQRKRDNKGPTDPRFVSVRSSTSSCFEDADPRVDCDIWQAQQDISETYVTIQLVDPFDPVPYSSLHRSGRSWQISTDNVSFASFRVLAEFQLVTSWLDSSSCRFTPTLVPYELLRSLVSSLSLPDTMFG